MANRRPPRASDIPLNTAVPDEIFDELSQLAGNRVVHISLWPDRLSDALDGAASHEDPPAEFDLDVYLEGGVYFELYGTLLFTSLDALPVQGDAGARGLLQGQVQGGVWLNEIAVDEEDQLVLVLGRGRRPTVYLVVGGWVLDEWEELPEDEGGR